MHSRRDFIKKAGLLTGAMGLLNQLPASIQQALSIHADVGSTFLDAEHIVFLMQEKRSFDHSSERCKVCEASMILERLPYPTTIPSGFNRTKTERLMRHFGWI